MSGLESPGRPPAPQEHERPPRDAGRRETEWTADHDSASRDTTPALGTAGGPAAWQRAVAGMRTALTRERWGDAQWSYLFGGDTSYAPEDERPDELDRLVADAAWNARRGEEPGRIVGPMMKPAVWTWEVPLYFWFGGIAAGSSFVALACDLAGDERSAVVARRVALAAVLPSPPLLIMDLGRPARFANMLRIFKPRSPMNLGAWCLSAFSLVGAGAVAADLAGRPRAARALGAGNAVLGGYLGSYTGVLLATTAVPVWARSRLFLGPIFVSTAAATGAAATRLALVAGGLPERHPTRQALGTVETAAMVTELLLSAANEHRLGRLAGAFEEGRAGVLFRAAEAGVLAGLALRLGRRALGPRSHHVASVLYLGAGLAFRYAWVEAGRQSANDNEAVARTARGRVTRDDEVVRPRLRRVPSIMRPGRRSPAAGAWSEGVRRLSLVAERAALRAGWRPGRGH